MDYGKYKFEQLKKQKEAKKNQKVVELKEIWLSMTIDIGDLNVKARQAQKFLTSGNKVKVSIRFRGREMAHTQNGLVTMKDFADACAEFGNVEKAAKLEGKSMMMFLAPKPKK
jgi:translation initiation factor IF-3